MSKPKEEATDLRMLIADVVGGIWENLPIRMDDPVQNVFTKLCFSTPNVVRDEEIAIIAREILNDASPKSI